MKMKILLGLLVVMALVVILNLLTPWQRQPVVFYEPIVLPIEVVEGDIIVLEDDSHIVMDEDKRINSIQYQFGMVTINATVHKNLWQILTNY